jgi:superfamily II DNA or RNA helicase
MMPWTLHRWQAEALPLVVGAVKNRERPLVSAFMGAGKSVLLAELCAASKIMEGRSIVVAAPRANLVEQLAATIGRRLGAENVGRYYQNAKEADRRVVVSTYQSLPSLVAAWKWAERSCGLLICDEAHRTCAPAVEASILALAALGGGRALPRIGVTATPYRSLPKEALTLWSSVVYRYAYADGLRDGVVVPHQVHCWDGGEFEASQIDEICLALLKKADVWPTLASADNIADADAFAAWLTVQGIPATSAHSRLKPKEIAARVAGLREGKYKVLVHVSMLAEGTDYPWLRGLLLRRKVDAKVRFVQEVGRVLRADRERPGKLVGHVLDPFDLMGLHGLNHPEALVKAIDESEDHGEGESGADGRDVAVKLAVSKMALEVWLWEVCAALEPHGLKVSGSGQGWRHAPASDAQVEGIAKMLKFIRWLPHERARERLRKWAKDGRFKEVSKGTASDLMALLFWLCERSFAARRQGAETGDFIGAKKLFEWPDGVVLPDSVPSLDAADGAL